MPRGCKVSLRTIIFVAIVLLLAARPLLLQLRQFQGSPTSGSKRERRLSGPTRRANGDQQHDEIDGTPTRQLAPPATRVRMPIMLNVYDSTRRDLAVAALRAVDAVIDDLRGKAMKRRLAADANPSRPRWDVGISPPPNDAPLRACFVTLVRHSKKEVVRLHRLLVNLRESLPLMATRYPIVVFHESAVNDEFMLRLLLEVADEHMRGHRTYPGTTDDAIPGGLGADIRDQMRVKEMLQRAVNVTSEDYTNVFGRLSQLKRVQMELAVMRYVFPAGVEMVTLDSDDFGELPRWVKPESLRRWEYPSSSYWGISYRHMCRFYGSRMFFTQAMQTMDFDYYMRLDVDSYILTRPRTVHVFDERDDGPAPTADPRDLGADPRAESGPRLVPREVDMDYFGEFLRRRFVHKATLLPSDGAGVLRKFRRVAIEGLQEPPEHNADLGPAKEDDDPRTQATADAAAHRLPSALPASPKYGFVMLHPQTQPILVEGLWDAYDEFLKKENDGGAPPSSGTIRGQSLFSAPRGKFLHYWDNFEVLDIAMLRSIDDMDDAQLTERTARLVAEASNGEVAPTKRYHIGAHRTAAEMDFVVLTKDLLADVKTRLAASLAAVRERSAGGDIDAHRRAHVEDAIVATDEFWDDLVAAHRHRVELAVKEHNSRYRALLRFTDFIDRQGGYYYHRWGDAEVRTLMISTFVAPQQILYVGSLPYQHYHNYHCPAGEPSQPGLTPFATAWELRVTDEGELTKLRSSVAAKVAKNCEASARRDFGEGSKSRGTAAMDPAEHAYERTVFQRDSREKQGWFTV